LNFTEQKCFYGFLSNFHIAIFKLEGQLYPSVEHYYQATKMAREEDRQRIACAETPALAFKLGRICPKREDWEQPIGTSALHNLFKDKQGVVVERVKDHFMFSALIAKFTQRKELRDALLLTGTEELIENSPTDFYWGIGRNRTGLNKLGRMLQLVRVRLPDHFKF
jgi:ribA/ribD-fused uncharacterized protein